MKDIFLKKNQCDTLQSVWLVGMFWGSPCFSSLLSIPIWVVHIGGKREGSVIRRLHLSSDRLLCGTEKSKLPLDMLAPPGSNVLPKILPFWCKSGGGGVICLWGVNWCKSVGVICSEGVKWCKSWDAMRGLLRNYPPWLKLPCKSGLQWAAMGGLFRNYPPWLKLPCKSGLQWAAMGGLFRIYPPWLKLPCKSGLQWAAMRGIFRNYPPHD